MKGMGLAKGLAVTFGTMTRRAHTQQYPDVEPDLPARSRGVIALLEENCTVCMLCSRECPDWCIYIDSHKEEVVVPGAARARQRNVLDRFAIDFSLCMYCGICIEACPFDALYWSPEFEYAEYDVRDLLHEKDRLREWVPTVPAPPAHDRNGELAKEEKPKPAPRAAGERPARPAVAGERPARPAGERPERPARPAGERPARPAKAAPAATSAAQTPTAAQTPAVETSAAETPAAPPQAAAPPEADA